jgi:hypothetical protein
MGGRDQSRAEEGSPALIPSHPTTGAEKGLMTLQALNLEVQREKKERNCSKARISTAKSCGHMDGSRELCSQWLGFYGLVYI